MVFIRHELLERRIYAEEFDDLCARLRDASLQKHYVLSRPETMSEQQYTRICEYLRHEGAIRQVGDHYELDAETFRIFDTLRKHEESHITSLRIHTTEA